MKFWLNFRVKPDQFSMFAILLALFMILPPCCAMTGAHTLAVHCLALRLEQSAKVSSSYILIILEFRTCWVVTKMSWCPWMKTNDPYISALSRQISCVQKCCSFPNDVIWMLRLDNEASSFCREKYKISLQSVLNMINKWEMETTDTPYWVWLSVSAGNFTFL